MADSTTDLVDPDIKALTADGDFAATLERVSFEAGIMLGAEALDAEQDYHRRRLNRHQRWLGGCGTVFGLAVDLPSGKTRGDGTPDIQLIVSPGYAIDGLGRELLVPESYSISLLDWLASQRASDPGSLTSVFAGGVLFVDDSAAHGVFGTDGFTPGIILESEGFLHKVLLTLFWRTGPAC